jgi:hypothetical protein
MDSVSVATMWRPASIMFAHCTVSGVLRIRAWTRGRGGSPYLQANAPGARCRQSRTGPCAFTRECSRLLLDAGLRIFELYRRTPFLNSALYHFT